MPGQTVITGAFVTRNAKSYEAFGDVPAGTSYRVTLLDREANEVVVLRCTGAQYDAYGSCVFGDEVKIPAIPVANKGRIEWRHA